MSKGISLTTQGLAGSAAVTAGTVQTQAGATPLTGMFNAVTCANANDGVLAPSAGTAALVTIQNLGIVALKVYPPVGGSLNGGAVNAAVALTASKNAMLVYSSALDATVIQAA